MIGKRKIFFESMLFSLMRNHIRHLPQNQQYDNQNVILDTAGYNMLTDEDYMRLALDEARKAALQDEVPIGAVLVQGDRILAYAHNAPIARNDASAHAEMLAIRMACTQIGNYRLTGARLYVTLEPCIMCAGAILQARLGQIIFGARDPKAGAVVSLYQVLNDHRFNHQVHLSEGILRDECGEILSRFFREKRVRAESATE
jgi:tRNA(adenine34) deaminase